jgi:hypothetical protein
MDRTCQLCRGNFTTIITRIRHQRRVRRRAELWLLDNTIRISRCATLFIRQGDFDELKVVLPPVPQPVPPPVEVVLPPDGPPRQVQHAMEALNELERRMWIKHDAIQQQILLTMEELEEKNLRLRRGNAD